MTPSKTTDTNLDRVFVKNALFNINLWLWKINKIELSKWPPDLRACSDRDIPIFVANNRMDRLKWAEPVKYMRAVAFSSGGTTITSRRRCFIPWPSSRHTPRYFCCRPPGLATSSMLFCSVLEKSHIGAKIDFEIWRFKGFFSLDPKKAPRKACRWPHLKS